MPGKVHELGGEQDRLLLQPSWKSKLCIQQTMTFPLAGGGSAWWEG